MKKFISLVLALVMALSLTTVAWGATPVSDATDLLNAVKADGTIELTADITTPLDIGKSDGTVARNIVIDLKGNTLTLGPAIGSTGTETNGMRVLAHSIVEIKNGTIAFSELQNAQGKNVVVGIANYGTLTLTDVEVKAGSTVQYTINNRGALTLAGTTSVANGGAGDKIAITNDPYNYVYTDFDASLTIDSAAVSVGTVQVERYGNAQNDGDVVLNISAGYVEEIVDDGATAVAVDGNISGGSFGTLPDESYLADGVTFVGNTVTVPEKKATSYEGLYARTADMAATAPTIPGVEIIVTPAKAIKYDKTTGNIVEAGEVEHVNITGWAGDYVFVNSTNDADVVLYKDEAGKQIRFRLALINTPEYAEGVKFTNFGDECGEVDYADYDKDDVYFTAKGDVNEGIYVADEDGFLNVMYGNKLVAVMPIGLTYTDDAVQHTPVMTNKNGETIAVECGACGLDAVKVPNVLSLPKGAEQIDTLTGVWYWPSATVVTPDTDKVESAETFDAGIAMYVGMSVMAAAGSAVVLKKKD